MRSPSTAARHGHARRCGFTLTELLIAVVISGILITIVLRFVQAQSRLAEIQHGREEVQQNLRSSLDLIASELRGVSAAAGGIEEAGDSSLTIRVPKAYGVVCNQPPTSSDPLYVLFSDPGEINLLWNSAVSLAVRKPDEQWETVSLSAVGSPSATAQSTCNSSLSPQPSAKNARDLVPTSPVPADVVGAPALLFDRVRYQSQPPGGTGTEPRWLQRSNGILSSGGFSMEPLAGPLRSEAGLRFRYYSDASPSPLPTPLTDPTSVTSVSVSIAMETRERDPARRQRAEDSVRVVLRN